MKIAYFGYDAFFSCMEFLVENGDEIKWVYSFEVDNERYEYNTRVLSLAKKVNASIKFGKPTTDDILKLIDEQCDLIVVAGYAYKIPVIEGMPRAVNIHPTALPEGRGVWPYPWIILKELKSSAVTIHKINENFDEGDIIVQKEFGVLPNDNLETISIKSQVAALDCLKMFRANINNMWSKAVPQKNGSYWPYPDTPDRVLNFNDSVYNIKKVARAFGKFNSYASFDGKDWIVQDITVWKEKHDFKPGETIMKTSNEYLISAKDGFVCIRIFEIDPDFVE